MRTLYHICPFFVVFLAYLSYDGWHAYWHICLTPTDTLLVPIDSCKNGSNTFAFVGEVNKKPQLSCGSSQMRWVLLLHVCNVLYARSVPSREVSPPYVYVCVCMYVIEWILNVSVICGYGTGLVLGWSIHALTHTLTCMRIICICPPEHVFHSEGAASAFMLLCIYIIMMLWCGDGEG